MPVEVPNLKALLAFEKVVESGSITQAGRIMNVSAGSVSRYIGILEHELGMPLFTRSKNRIEITGAGQKFYEDIHRSLEAIRRATREISPKDNRMIRLWCYPTFANEWILPRVQYFQESNAAKISIVTGTEPPADLMRHCDLAIVQQANIMPGYLSRFLFEENLVPVCIPSLVARPPLPVEAALSLPVACSSQRAESRQDWATRHLGRPLNEITVLSDQSSVALRAAREGLGITLAADVWVSIALSSRALILPFGARSTAGDKMFAVWDPDQSSNPLLMQLLDWITSEMQVCQNMLREIYQRLEMQD